MICGRPDLGERYLCALVARGRHGADPIVRVLAVVRYPRQHALYWPDVAIEIPPVEAGCVCRLHLYGRAVLVGRRGRLTGAMRMRRQAPIRLYALSLKRAQRAALAREAGEAREIIRRHIAGEYRRRRAVVRLRGWEAAKYGNA